MDVQAGTFDVSGSVTNSGTILATAGTLRFSNATVSNVGRTITADRGIVEVANSTINGGSLLTTDNADSFVRFSGDVTLNGVAWEDPGAGELQVYHTTARLLGDYETHLPAGYRLVVQSDSWTDVLILSGGTFTNEGTIELHNSGSLELASDTTLAGSGEVAMTSAGWGDTPLISGLEGATLTIGMEQRVHGEGLIV
jgi:hypothetical protein